MSYFLNPSVLVDHFHKEALILFVCMFVCVYDIVHLSSSPMHWIILSSSDIL